MIVIWKNWEGPLEEGMNFYIFYQLSENIFKDQVWYTRTIAYLLLYKSKYIL